MSAHGHARTNACAQGLSSHYAWFCGGNANKRLIKATSFIPYTVSDIFAYMRHYVSLYIFHCVDKSEGQVCYFKTFLVACTRLYKPLSRLVGQSVGPSVAEDSEHATWRSALLVAKCNSMRGCFRPSVGVLVRWSVGHAVFLSANFNE